MSLVDDFSDVVGLLYEAALDSDRWETVLRRTAALVGAESGLLAIGTSRRPEEGIEVPITLEVDPVQQQRWLDSYVADDVWWLAFSERWNEGVLTAADCVAVDVLHRTRIYNEVLVHAGIEDGLFAGIARAPGSDAIACFYRGPRRDRFGSHDVSLLRSLLPHFERAAKIHDRVRAVAAAHEARASILERLPHGLLWLDEAGRVLGMNPAAERIVARGDGLRIHRGQIGTVANAARSKLHDAVAIAVATARRGGTQPASAVRIERVPPGPAYTAMAVPVPHRTGELTFGFETQRPAVLLLVSEPDAPPQPPAEVLRRLFGLPPAIGRLAAALAAGKSLAQHAEEAGVTIGTARHQMKTLLLRMGARRQADAIRMILASVAALDCDSNDSNG